MYRVTPRHAFRRAGFWLLAPFLLWSFGVVVASSHISRFVGSNVFRDGTWDLRLSVAKFIGFINILLLIVLTVKFGEWLGSRKLGSSIGAWTFVGWTLLTLFAWQAVGGTVAALLFVLMA